DDLVTGVQTCALPIWFGGHHPNAIRRAVELGDGFIGAGSASTAAFLDEVKLLRGVLEEAGRDPATFPLGKRVYIAVDRDRARAEIGRASCRERVESRV